MDKEANTMSDEVETIFRWRCPKCGRIFEEGNFGSLEAIKQMHEKSCESKKWEFKGSPPKKYT